MRDRIRLTGSIQDVRLLDRNDGASTLDVVVQAEREKAYAVGFVDGRSAERRDATERLDAAAEQLVQEREAAETELAAVAIELATSIARTLLRTEIHQGNYDIERIVRETLAEANVGRNPCVVHLNPSDYARLAEARFRSGTTIQADNEVALGDVHVETSLGLLVREALGSVDAIERRLREELS